MFRSPRHFRHFRLISRPPPRIVFFFVFFFMESDASCGHSGAKRGQRWMKQSSGAWNYRPVRARRFGSPCFFCFFFLIECQRACSLRNVFSLQCSVLFVDPWVSVETTGLHELVCWLNCIVLFRVCECVCVCACIFVFLFSHLILCPKTLFEKCFITFFSLKSPFS